MAEDIVPGLWNGIKRDYEAAVRKNARIRRFLDELEKGRADGREASLYAAELGKCAAEALAGNLTEERLPGGKIYWNILERTLVPLLKDILERVNLAAAMVQEREDREKGIGLKPQEADWPEARIKDLMRKLVSIFEGKGTADE